MKKHFLVFIALVLAAGAYGQISLTYEQHAYRIGDRHDFYLAQTADEGKSGTHITWDYSDLVPQSTFTSFMIDPLYTEKGMQVPGANLALVENSNIFYFNVTKKGVQQHASANPCSIFMFDSPYEKLRFPFSYGTVVKGNFTNALPNGNKIVSAGSYVIEGDAWGTLILPNGVYKKTLRVKQTRIMLNSDSTELREITYRWYSNNVRYPLLVIIKQENKGKTTVSKVAYNAHYPLAEIVSENEKAAKLRMADINLVVFPNPFLDQVQISYHLENDVPLSVELLNSAGNVIEIMKSPLVKEAGAYSETLPLTLPVGTYFIKVNYGEQVVVKKIVKL